MRLDRYLTDSGRFSRREAEKVVKFGLITVNGEVIRDRSVHIDEKTAEVKFRGELISYEKYKYVMLYKPKGYISATETGNSDSGRTVMSLLPEEFTRLDMFPCGRLDIDTTGLLLITNDGDTAHNLLSPKKHVMKTYGFVCASPMTDEMVKKLESGIEFEDFTSKEAKVDCVLGETKGRITIHEGKFHQIKRMFVSVGNEICELERVSFGPLTLDDSGLNIGEWRYLSEDEISLLLKAAGK